MKTNAQFKLPKTVKRQMSSTLSKEQRDVYRRLMIDATQTYTQQRHKKQSDAEVK